MSIAEKTKAIRKAENLSQKALAKLIGSTQTEVSFIERGFIPPNSDKVAKIEHLYETMVRRKRWKDFIV